MQQKHLFLFKTKQSWEMCLSLAPYELKGVSMPKIQDSMTKWKYKKSPGCYYLCHAITISVAQIAQMMGLCPVEPTGSTESGSFKELTYTCQNPVISFLNPSAVFFSPLFWEILIHLGIGESPMAPIVCRELTWDKNAWCYAQGAWTWSGEMESRGLTWQVKASSPRAAFSSFCC